VDLFHTSRDRVAENARRLNVMATDEEIENAAKYLLACNTCYRSYNELVRLMLLMKILAEYGDAEALQSTVRNVSQGILLVYINNPLPTT
jgi:protein-arginine kinase activator protein McsA